MKLNKKTTYCLVAFLCIAIFVEIKPISSGVEATLTEKLFLPSAKKDSDTATKNKENNNFLFGNWKLDGEKNDRINVLLLGIGGEDHEAGYLTDTIILASFSPSKNKSRRFASDSDKLAFLSIPRDLFIKMPRENYHTRINAVKYRADQKQGNGIEILQEAISEITGIEINYYMIFDFSKFEELIDELGGIDIELKEPVYDPKFPRGESEGYETFQLSAGAHHINGDTALKLARSRHSVWGDFDRAARQQEILKAIYDKIWRGEESSINNIKKMFSLWNYFRNNIETDIGILEIRRMLEISQNIKNIAIINQALTSKPDGELINARVKMPDGVAMVLLPKDESYNEIQEIAEDIFDGL